MNPHIIPLHLTNLHKIASLNLPSKIKVSGVKILGDSLSDPGGVNGMYEKKILGCIPLKFFLNKSPHKQFTNGYGWEYAFEKVLEFAKESNNPLENPHLPPIHGFFKCENRAQGGAMAYNYIENIFNIIKFFRGFLLSLVLTNIQNEAKKLQKDIKLNPDDLAIIFAGANDLVTAGYCDKGGAVRAIQGIAKTIDILTSSQQKNANYTKNVLVFTLPDFSKTPRFSKKTEIERKQAKEACGSFNERLRDLAKNYQYFDFSLCDIYQVAKKEDADPTEIREKGIVITGLGSIKKIYFVNHGQFILKDNKEISIDIRLSKTEKKLLGNKLGKVLKEGKVIDLEKFIHKLTSKAKLSADVKIFDAAAVFEKIDENPEAYGFTSGCAVYYLSASRGEEAITNKIISGNAVIIQEINQNTELMFYFVKDGKLIRELDAYRLPKTVRLKLSEKNKNLLYKKFEEDPLKDSISKLAGCEDKHDHWTTHIVQSAIKAYKDKFNEKIQLTDIYASVLSAIKKNFPNQQDIFWDDLHPSVIVHFLLETMFEAFFKSNYAIKQPRVWQDDMAISYKVSPKIELPTKSAESPDDFLSLKRHSLR